MKKILSIFSIALILNNILIFSVFAGIQIDFTTFTIKINDGSAYTGDIEVNPGDNLGLLLRGKNIGDQIANPKFEFTFSNSNFSYDNSNLETYINGTTINQNISISDFNPGIVNNLKVADIAETGNYVRAYYIDLTIDDDTSENVLTIDAQITSDTSSSNSISRNIYINSNPHIVNYYFEDNGSTTTQLVRGGGEDIDLIVEVKDYNGCDNIDNGDVIVNLSDLGLSSSESLNFDSCDGNTAKFKKTGITTLLLPGSISFSYSDFSATDESGNENKPNDSSTSFDDEDIKSNLTLEIVSAGTPTVNGSLNDEFIGGSSNLESILSFIGNQNGEYKIIKGDNLLCENGTTLTDWTSYTANNNVDSTINSSDLDDGINNLVVCVKNDEDLVGSFNLNLTKDTTSPIIENISVGPDDVVLEDSDASFRCSEDGNYVIEKGGNGTLNSGTSIGTGSVVAGNANVFTILNTNIDVNSNDFYIYCIDESENIESNIININKTTPPPSFVGEVNSLEDNDDDLDGLDGRDIEISWNNSAGINYDFFESYRVYIIPSNVDIDLDNHSYINLNSDENANSFVGDSFLVNDSLGNTLLSNSSYKACVTIMGTNGVLGTAGCSSSITLVGDDVLHSSIVSARFSSSTNLEITTDTTLDTTTGNHDASLISFTLNGSSVTGQSISSIDGNKINVSIPNLGASSETGTDLIVLTGAIRSDGGGFNDNHSFGSITDGQEPLIYNFGNNTSSLYSDFFSGSINLSYAFSEEMKNTDTRIKFNRVSGSLDSTEHIVYIGNTNLLGGVHTQDIDLSTIGLVDGSNYSIYLEGNDIAGNYNKSITLTDLKYDSVGPEQIIQNITSLYSTITPELTWNIPSDNEGNGSGIKEYNLNIYDGVDCTGNLNQSHTINTNSKIIDAVGNIADYSWKVNSVDNLLNNGIESICSTFRVDTSVPIYSNYEINDTVLNSTNYVQENNSVEVTSTITDTNINHIWADLSMLTGTGENSNELCGTPSVGINCTYVGNTVTYTFNVGNSITDGVKQVLFNSQNTSGGNDVNQIVSITADSNAPSILAGTITGPTGIIGGTGVTITWDTTKITDTIGIDYLEVQYSTGAGIWSTIGTGSNIGTLDWNLNSIVSGNDYKVKIIAFDNTGNNSELESSIFEIDRTDPLVPSNTLIFPNGSEILGGSGTISITWNNGLITDDILATNPISLYYSLDNGSNWILIENNLDNDGLYEWSHGNINSSDLLIKIEAVDSVGNFASDNSDNVFTIDTEVPELSFDFSSTPVNGSYINNSGFDILANTSDLKFKDSGYSFLNLTTGNYFDGTSFSGTSEIINNICSDITVNGTNNSCDLISFNLTSSITDGNNYRLQLKSTDEAGNSTLSIPVDYIGDTVNPNVSINTYSGVYFKDNIVIGGISSDLGSGISSTKVQIKKGTDYWDGSSFVNSIQTLNTNSSNNFADWTYDFVSNTSDGDYLITAVSYDKSYKVNNSSETSITVIKDTTIPTIVGGSSIFSSPSLNDIYIGGENVNITWDSGALLDNGSGLASNPIQLEYFDGFHWNTISTNESNDGLYTWTSSLIDANNVKIRLGVSDSVGNIAYQNSDNFTVDSTNPTIDTIETMDLDANGEIDALNITMSEDIRDSSVSLSDFVISNGIGNPTSFETGNSVDDEEFVLKFTNNGNTGIEPTVSYTKGSLVDIAGKYLSTDNSVSSNDKASPRLLKSELFDNDSNGKFDTLVSTFSEDLSTTTDITAWNISNSLIGLSINSVSVSGDEATILLNESDDFNTSVGLMKNNLTSNSNWKDLSNNSVGSVVDGDIDDLAKPIGYSSEYLDLDSDYKVDRVNLSFSEDLIGFDENDFTITNLIKGTGVKTDNVITFDITETSSDNDTGIVATYTFVGGNLKDSSNNLVDSLNNINIDDKVSPKLLSIDTNDIDGNGKIDSILLSYSEDINSDFSTLIGEVDGYNFSSFSKGSDSELLINIDEKDNYDSSETPLVRINSNNSLDDLFGNKVEEFTFTASVDKVGPVIIGARYDETSHDVIIQASETLEETDFTTGNFSLNNAGSYNISSVDYANNSITLSSETITFGSTEISFSSNSIGDLLGNKQNGTYFIKIAPPIIINEILLSNNSDNNYVELRNLSSNPVDISGYTIAGITIPGATMISADGYYLISKSSLGSSIINVDPDLVDSNLNISGTQLILNNGVMDIDFASLTSGLFDTVTPKSVERKDNVGDGLLTINWYTAQDSVGFDSTTSFGTPGIQNIYDPISPTIDSYSPIDNTLFSGGNIDIEFNYSDNIGGLGVDTSSDLLSLNKWNGSVWSGDISSSYVDFGSKVITSTDADYSVEGLDYGKYKVNFSIYDKAGNLVSKSIIFYIDEFTFDLNIDNISIGSLNSGFNTFSESELVLTIETVGAGFSIDMFKDGFLSNNGININDFNGSEGFGFNLYDSGYSGIISSIGSNINIINQSQDLNLDGNKNTYIYKIKYGANINVSQGAGNYEVNPGFNVLTNY